MVYLFDGAAWATLGGHDISAQDQHQPHTYHKWGEEPPGWEDPISTCSPNTLHKLGVEDLFELTRLAHFIWMIAWVWESLIGNNIPHVDHHSYLKEAIRLQGGFQLHLPPFYDVSHMVFHAWEETLEEIFVADHVEQWWRIFDEEATRRGGEDFSLLIQFLEDKQHFGGEDCNIPNF